MCKKLWWGEGLVSKNIEKKDLFEKQPYRSILSLLSIISEGLEPKQILSTLADQKTLKDLKKRGKIKYDYKKENRIVKEKPKRDGTLDYYFDRKEK